jgi:hypothetical protein
VVADSWLWTRMLLVRDGERARSIGGMLRYLA